MNKNMTLIRDLITEISMGPFGSDIKVDNFVNEGIPVLNGSNVSGVSLKDGFSNYVTIEKADALKKANAKRGDIVVTHRGTLGQISYIPENSKFDRYIISQSQFRVRLKREIVNPIYFTNYFHTEEGQKRLLSFKNHVGVPALAQATTNFRLLEFPLIPLKDQNNIAKILTDLDAKIELNNKINTEIEAMAKLIYDYWFVQFDFPNENGLPYKSSRGKMIWNNELKREIPEGWEVQDLSIISNITTGKLDSNAEVLGAEYPFYTCASEPSTTDTFAFDDTVILVAGNNASGNFHINRHKGKFNAYQRTYIFTAKHQSELEYLYQVLKTETKLLKSQGKGSQTKFLTIGMLTSIKTFSKTGIMKNFDNIVKPMYEQQVIIKLQNQKLTELRDWLLPMLMNGQVKVETNT